MVFLIDRSKRLWLFLNRRGNNESERDKLSWFGRHRRIPTRAKTNCARDRLYPGHSKMFKQMVAEVVAISQKAIDVQIKVPFGTEGLIATGELSRQGVAVAGTTVTSVTRAMLFAKARAKSVIPYYG